VVDAEQRLEQILVEIGAANSHDPGRVAFDGNTLPTALAEGQQAHVWARHLQSGASDALQIATRAHHLRRWEIERGSYPRTRDGYLAWRTYLYDFHARTVGDLMHQAGYPRDTIDRVAELMRKRSLKRDADAQTYEDAVSIAFLEVRLSPFLDDVSEEQSIRALRRTWAKMSPAGREAALGLALEKRAALVVQRALAP